MEMSKLCSTCLSRDRMLLSFNKVKYGSLFGSRKVIMKVEHICWECEAMFRRLLQFKLQVLKAQEYLEINNEVTDVDSLSVMRCSRTIYNDVCCEQIHVNEENTLATEIKPVLDLDIIKYENEFIDELTNTEFDDLRIQNAESPDVKPNEIMPIDDNEIKNEDDSVSDNEIVVQELKIDNLKVKRKNSDNEQNITSVIDTKKSRNGKKLIYSKDNYIVITMTEEEMQAKRDADRQLHRYKNLCKYKCDLCIAGFFHKNKYERHMRNKHSEKYGKYQYQCSVCEVRFTNFSHYNEHSESHYRKYRCKDCPFVGYRLSEMTSHEGREHGLFRFLCKRCPKGFPSLSSLRSHRNLAHEQPVKCESCGKMFRTKETLQAHIRVIHNYVPKSQCGVCGEHFRNVGLHMLTHSAAPPPEDAYCAECDKRFSSVNGYKTHLKMAAPHRPPESLKYQCPHCAHKCVTPSALKRHVRARHSKERPFKCHRCDKGFEAKCKLRQHIQYIHEGVERPKNKICHICGRGFTTKPVLVNHIRIHTGEKPFRCDICSAAFGQKASLGTHIRGVHLKVKSRPSRSNGNRNSE